MKRSSFLTGGFLALMCLAFVLPLVVAPEESDWFSEWPRQMVSWFGVVLTAALLRYVARRTDYSLHLMRICEFVLVGVTGGFFLGTILHLDSGKLPNWFFNLRFIPFSVKEFFANNELETTYAPAFGMIVGIGIGLLYCYLRRKKIAAQNPAR